MKTGKRYRMRKRIWCMILCLSMILSYVSPTIYAGTDDFLHIDSGRTFRETEKEETTETPHIVLNTGEGKIQTPSDADEEDGGSLGKADGNSKTDIDIEETPSDAESATPPNAKKYTLDEVREMINALPDVKELQKLTMEEQNAFYEAAQEAWDAYEALSEEEQAELKDEYEKLVTIMEYFNRLIAYTDTPSLNGNGVYEIANAAQLYWYANEGHGYGAILINDITIGTKNNPYVDWYVNSTDSSSQWMSLDGQGHTIEMYLTYSNVDGASTGDMAGLFRANYASFKNLILKGSLTCNSTYRVGALDGTGYGVTFENIVSYVDVTNQSSGPTGGLVGYFGGSGATAKNCAVYAEVSGTGVIGGLIGAGWGGNQAWKIVNSVFYGSLSGADGKTGALMGYSYTGGGTKNSSLVNSYYPDSYVSVGGAERTETLAGVNKSTPKTSAQFASGEVTYLLNSGVTDGSQIWYQTCGEGFPALEGDTVYEIAETAANLYSNTLITKNSDNYYEISTPDELMTFAELANNGNKEICGKLMKDLDMSGYAWVPICSTGLYYSDTYSDGNYSDAGYAGTFDGNKCTIRNLSVTSISGKEGTYGVFGSLSGTVRYLGVDGFAYSLNNASDMRTGAVVGQILGGTVEHCFVKNATITPGSKVTGGIAGCNYAGTIESCYVYSSSFSGTSKRYGWIVGDNRADLAGDRLGTIKNCYTDGTTVIGSYTGYETSCESKTAAQFASGEVTYLLNGDQSNIQWFQTCGTGLPAFSGLQVYQMAAAYVNTEPPTMNSQGVFELSKKEHVLALAEYVNAGNTDADAVMMNDIDMEDTAEIGIGTEAAPYSGCFDGGGYTLTVALNGGYRMAPIAYAGNVTVQNLIVSGTIRASGKFAAGMIGNVRSGSASTLRNCISDVEIISSVNGDGTHGGLVGVIDIGTLTIDYCAFRGAINGTSTGSCGGLVGWTNQNAKTVIQNSYVSASFTVSTSGSDTFSRNPNYATVEDSCYVNILNTAKTGDTIMQITQEEMKTGKGAWWCNGQSDAGTWKQTLGEDDTPDFDGDEVYRMADDYVPYEPPKQDAEGCFEIETAENLMAFSSYANKIDGVREGNYDACAKVMKDIDMSGYEWLPIAQTAMSGDIGYGYIGSFDGQGHVISKLTVKTPTAAVTNGLFGTVYNGGLVKKVGVSGLQFDDDTFDHRGGGIAGQLMEGGVIENCFVTQSTIKAASRVVGGIAGMNRGTIRNCCTTGLTLAAHNNRYGGICGDFNSGTVENCYTDYSTIGSTASGQSGTVLDSEGGVSNTRFACGEITYKLNGDQSNIVWYQTIGSSDAPGFDGEQVYYGYAVCEAEEKVYTNSSVTQEAHWYTGTPVFEWAEDYSSCTAVFSCLKDSSHEKKNVTCTVSTRISDDGRYYYYTATAENNEKTFTDEQKVFNAVVSVDLNWTSMEFVYGNEEWKPENHSLGNGSWSVKENGGTIRAENKGTVWVKLDFAFQSLLNGVSGKFENDEVVLEYGKEGSTSFMPDGIPKERFEQTQLGTITVNITRANKGALDLTGYALSDYAEAICEYLEDGTTELSLTLGTENLTKDYAEAITNGISAAGLSTCDLTLTDVKIIYPLAFSGCSWITSLSSPSAITIYNSTFQNCSNLKKIDLPNATDVKAQAFLNCGALTEVKLPKATHVGLDTFKACTSLANVSLPNVTEVEVRGFYDCRNLETISLPKLQKLGDSAFKNCSKLQSVRLPSLHTLGDKSDRQGKVFANCGNLTNLTIGTAVTTFYGSDMFQDTDTENLTLTLNSSQSGAVFGEAGTWLGYTFKEIKIYGAD